MFKSPLLGTGITNFRHTHTYTHQNQVQIRTSDISTTHRCRDRQIRHRQQTTNIQDTGKEPQNSNLVSLLVKIIQEKVVVFRPYFIINEPESQTSKIFYYQQITSACGANCTRSTKTLPQRYCQWQKDVSLKCITINNANNFRYLEELKVKITPYRTDDEAELPGARLACWRLENPFLGLQIN